MSDIENQIKNDVIIEGLQDNNPSMRTIIIEKIIYCLYFIFTTILMLIVIIPLYYLILQIYEHYGLKL